MRVWLYRVIATGLVMLGVAVLESGWNVIALVNAALTTAVIVLVQYLVDSFGGLRMPVLPRALISFVVVWAAIFLVSNMTYGAAIASAIISIVDAFLIVPLAREVRRT